MDTLGKWMAHHIAELINDAETATAADRSSKVTVAIEAILMFWDHRATVDRIDPLRDLKPLLRVIKTLDPEENRWGIYFRRDGYGAVAEVYSAFRELVIFELLRQSKHDIDLAKASGFVSNEERAIIESLNLWIADYQKKDIEGKAKRGKAPAKGKLDTKALVLEKVENARRTLDALVDEINDKPRASLTTISHRLLRKLVGQETVTAPEIEVVDGNGEDDNSTP